MDKSSDMDRSTDKMLWFNAWNSNNKRIIKIKKRVF